MDSSTGFEELHEVQLVCGISIIDYPTDPDPSTESGWATVPAVMLLVDFTGREDIAFHSMRKLCPLTPESGALNITPTDETGTCAYVFLTDFGDDINPLRVFGVAPPEVIDMFCRTEVVLLADDGRITDEGTAPVFAITANDPVRWSFLLDPAVPGREEPPDDPPPSPTTEEPVWNAHRRAWLVHDPGEMVWFEYRDGDWHPIERLIDRV